MENDFYQKQRKEMVNRHLKLRGINNLRVLKAMKNVPREEFLPPERQEFAYNDGPLPIGEGQTISQPYIVAYMTECLQLSSDMKVLEIGTGSGYQSAVLAELVREVYTVETIKSHYENAKKNLQKLGYKNIFFLNADGHNGWQEYAPYDRIIVTCAPEEIPIKLVEQLSVNGRMILPVGSRGDQKLFLVEKRNNQIETEERLPVIFVPMVKRN